jgi:hypothetical protein
VEGGEKGRLEGNEKGAESGMDEQPVQEGERARVGEEERRVMGRMGEEQMYGGERKEVKGETEAKENRDEEQETTGGNEQGVRGEGASESNGEEEKETKENAITDTIRHYRAGDTAKDSGIDAKVHVSLAEATDGEGPPTISHPSPSSSSSLPILNSNPTTFDPDCTECQLSRPAPSPEDLVMYLHAHSYKVCVNRRAVAYHAASQDCNMHVALHCRGQLLF